MEMKQKQGFSFSFRPLPWIKRPLNFFQLPDRTGALGPLQDLPGTWTGRGFNVIWRPSSDPRSNHFLELNLTSETLEFEAIDGEIPNRGLLQDDIFMYGLTYRQHITDFNTEAGLHVETGIWATVPKTEDPDEPPTVVRMASIPHGTTVLAQGESHGPTQRPPEIRDVDISPFEIDHPNRPHPFPNESNLFNSSDFRSPPGDIVGVSQWMVDNPNLILIRDLEGLEIDETVALHVASTAKRRKRPLVGGGIANTAFLEGNGHGPNAEAAEVDATFWIERVPGRAGRPGFHQLQYTQTVLLNFAGLSWPHISVATLRRE
jgi:hypothetical protein